MAHWWLGSLAPAAKVKLNVLWHRLKGFHTFYYNHPARLVNRLSLRSFAFRVTLQALFQPLVFFLEVWYAFL